MRSPLWTSAATLWHDLGDGTWARRTLLRCHYERREGSEAAAVGPDVDCSDLLVTREAVAVESGDYVVEGASSADVPPASARRVSSVTSYDLGRGLHHTEVRAR